MINFYSHLVELATDNLPVFSFYASVVLSERVFPEVKAERTIVDRLLLWINLTLFLSFTLLLLLKLIAELSEFFELKNLKELLTIVAFLNVTISLLYYYFKQRISRKDLASEKE